MRRTWLSVHRYLGVAAAVFWLVQALTGVAIVFRWELDDARIAGATVDTRTAALGARIETILREGGRVDSLWASSHAANRFDIYYSTAMGADRVMRVDGTGRVLRDGPDGELVANGGIFNTLTAIHHSLAAGSVGEWIVAVSGVLLLTNLLLGLRVAWPRAGTWRRALTTLSPGPAPARMRALHRMIGLWGALPAIVLVSAGVLLSFEEGLRERLDAGMALPAPPTVRGVAGPAVNPAPAAALDIALARYPGALVSAMTMPSEEAPWYQVRLRVPGEMARNWGKTTLFVDAATGTVVGDHDGRRAPAARAFVDSLYPLHTGQWARLPGRFVSLLHGIWLATMVVVGTTLWLKRRPRN